MSKALLLKTNGIMEEVNFEGGLDFYYRTINCGTIDTVNAYGFQTCCHAGICSPDEEAVLGDVCLVVDDEGLLKANPELNLMGSLLYGVRVHGNPLAGDVLVCKNHYTPDGTETVGFEPDELETVKLYAAVLRLESILE